MKYVINMHETSVDPTLQPEDVASPELAELQQTVTDEADAEVLATRGMATESAPPRDFTSASDPGIWRMLEGVLSENTSETELFHLSQTDAQYTLNAVQQVVNFAVNVILAAGILTIFYADHGLTDHPPRVLRKCRRG